MTTTVRLLALLLAAPCATLRSQQLRVVDAAGGAGVHFTDLPPALAAAQPGDTILVRARASAVYQAATTNKGVTILGENLPVVQSNPGGTLGVTALPGTQTFAIHGIQSVGVGQTNLRIEACPGRVHLDRVLMRQVSGQPCLLVQQSAAVTLAGCELLDGGPALRAVASKVVLAGCTLMGASYPTLTLPATALSSDGATVMLIGGSASGGHGASPQPIPGASAVIAFNGSALTIGGDAQTTLAAGFAAFSPPAAISLNASTLRIDPAVRLISGSGPISGNGTVTTARFGALLATGAGGGGAIATSLYAPAGHLVVLLAALPRLPFQAPPFGELWLDPLALLLVTASFQGAGEHWNVSIPLPPGTPRGVSLGLQGLSGPGVDQRLTNPVVVVTR